MEIDNETTEPTEPTEQTETTELPTEPTEPTELPTPKLKHKSTKLPKIPKPVKQQYEAKCTHCSKIFKNKNSYEKHTIEQTCFKSNEITYCNVCLYTYETHLKYKHHLFSIEHLNNIGFNDTERLKTKEVSKVHLADPYLNNNDINKISKKNLGDSFTFIFNTGNTQTVTLVNNTNNNTDTKNNSDDSKNNIIPLLNTNTNTENASISINIPENNILHTPHKPDKPQPTTRQIKIISFLEKQTSIEESGKMFYKMLDNKLQLEDYKGLQNMIKYLNIGEDFKINYINIIESFVSLLVKQSTSGIKNYKDKNISQLVINLTS